MSEKRILGIDFGEARIGVAVSDPTLTIAVPLEVIEAKKVDPLERIVEIVREYNIFRVVMGLPKLMSGEEGEMARKVRAFKEKLEKAAGIDVVLIDERFTSKIAERELRMRRVKPSKDKKKVDLFAAALLLQEYLNSLKNE